MVHFWSEFWALQVNSAMLFQWLYCSSLEKCGSFDKCSLTLTELDLRQDLIMSVCL